ncbi:tRNA uridine-5-carboxymethylaminomethyl(34) synthesis GTPase MnmE [bacterium]|nr:tRNA uridine-5-carboxymethylaminomethyl(34) synthesis GTPase MnmE [bacterium]
MTHMMNDTIAAIATPPGIGGIAIIRISGPNAWNAVKHIFKSDISNTAPESHHACHGWIMNGKEPVDEVLLTWFEAPNSYTGEEVVEVSGHGGPLICQCILDLLLNHGIRTAEPGEFTKRAFLNGKLDLNQAEAVADLIHAKTEYARRVAAYQLEGRLSERITTIRDTLIRNCSLLELELDFGEEDVEFASRNDLKSGLISIQKSLNELLSTFNRGRVCRDGIRLVIAGRPNVGKSSLLNRLIEKERAIVTDVPGTTRDTIEEMLDIEGVLFVITDTAGLRSESGLVEKEGIRRTYAALNAADMIIWMTDASQPWLPEDENLLLSVRQAQVPCFYTVNKIDLKPHPDISRLTQGIPNQDILKISALTGQGIDTLIQKLKSTALSGDVPHEGETLITRARHAEAVRSALNHVQSAQDSIKKNMSQEFIALDLRGALEALGCITGQTTPDDILNQIFSEFCIGK